MIQVGSTFCVFLSFRFSFRKSQLVEDRKIYVRRVSSKVCDVRKSYKSSNGQGAGLYEIFLEVALFYDRQTHRHTPYIKSCYPSQVFSLSYFPFSLVES